MKKAILGKKLGMTQIFMPDGSLVPLHSRTEEDQRK